MKRIASRAAVAVLTLGCATVAQAVPIKFDFSGVVYATSPDGVAWAGQLASAQFLLETDSLFQIETNGQVPSAFFADRERESPNRPNPVLGNVSIGSDSFSMNDFASGYGGIVFNDDCAPPVCGGNAYENWNVQLFGATYPIPGNIPDGLMMTRSLAFSSLPVYGPEGPLPTDFFDVTTVKPEDILTLPLLQTIGLFQQSTYNCQDGNCTQLSSMVANFAVDSVTREAVATAVPEPGTLELMAMALAGLWMFRRRARVLRAG